MAINKKLIHVNTFSNFNSYKLSANTTNTEYTLGLEGEKTTGSPDILWHSIVFIKDVQKIWTHGQIYSAPQNVAELEENYKNLPVIAYDETSKTLKYSGITLNPASNEISCNISGKSYSALADVNGRELISLPRESTMRFNCISKTPSDTLEVENLTVSSTSNLYYDPEKQFFYAMGEDGKWSTNFTVSSNEGIYLSNDYNRNDSIGKACCINDRLYSSLKNIIYIGKYVGHTTILSNINLADLNLNCTGVDGHNLITYDINRPYSNQPIDEAITNGSIIYVYFGEDIKSEISSKIDQENPFTMTIGNLEYLPITIMGELIYDPIQYLADNQLSFIYYNDEFKLLTVGYSHNSGFASEAEMAYSLEESIGIDGLQVNGGSQVTRFGVCENEDDVLIEARVTINDFFLCEGATINVYFPYGNSETAPKLKVNDEESYDIVKAEGEPVGEFAQGTYMLIFHDECWEMVNRPQEQIFVDGVHSYGIPGTIRRFGEVSGTYPNLYISIPTTYLDDRDGATIYAYFPQDYGDGSTPINLKISDVELPSKPIYKKCGTNEEPATYIPSGTYPLIFHNNKWEMMSNPKESEIEVIDINGALHTSTVYEFTLEEITKIINAYKANKTIFFHVTSNIGGNIGWILPSVHGVNINPEAGSSMSILITFQVQDTLTRYVVTVNVDNDLNYTSCSSTRSTRYKFQSNVIYGECSTAAGTAAKAVTLITGHNFELSKGVQAVIKFTNTNTATNPTLNINNSGAKPLMFNGAAATNIEANSIYTVVYDGTNWNIVTTAFPDTINTARVVKDFGDISTFANIAQKEITIDGYDTILPGTSIKVNFALGNAAENITINLNGFGAVPLTLNGTPVSASNFDLVAGRYYTIIFQEIGRNEYEWQLQASSSNDSNSGGGLDGANVQAVSIGESVDDVEASFVAYTSQTLTDTQKAQARTNIGAASIDEIPTESTISTMGFTKNTGTITAIQANGTSVATSGTANIPAASTSKYGVTKLSSATNSTSTSLAATASAVKAAYDLANGKQAALVSGTNIKTINGQSLLGSGDITISGGGSSADLTNYYTKTEIDSLVGNINSVLESIINGGSGGAD